MAVKEDMKPLGLFFAGNVGLFVAFFLLLTIFGIPIGLFLGYVSWKWCVEAVRMYKATHAKTGRHVRGEE